MTLWLPHAYASPSTSSFKLQSLTFSSFKPKISISFSTRRTATPMSMCIRASSSIPARDRIINFGKHKGKMLGTIPSSYLKWASTNLGGEWAKLADQVLQDPIYQDRIEWEFADRILTGDNIRSESFRGDFNGVDELQDIADRFGWDFNDEEGWGRVKFGLLGTSNGGRIPRISENGGVKKKKKTIEKVKKPILTEGDGRRRERIERLRMTREVGRVQDKKLELGIGIRTAIVGNSTKPRFGNGNDAPTRVTPTEDDDDDDDQDRTAKTRNPFPGRDAFLKKVLDRKKKPL